MILDRSQNCIHINLMSLKNNLLGMIDKSGQMSRSRMWISKEDIAWKKRVDDRSLPCIHTGTMSLGLNFLDMLDKIGWMSRSRRLLGMEDRIQGEMRTV